MTLVLEVPVSAILPELREDDRSLADVVTKEVSEVLDSEWGQDETDAEGTYSRFTIDRVDITDANAAVDVRN